MTSNALIIHQPKAGFYFCVCCSILIWGRVIVKATCYSELVQFYSDGFLFSFSKNVLLFSKTAVSRSSFLISEQLLKNIFNFQFCSMLVNRNTPCFSTLSSSRSCLDSFLFLLEQTFCNGLRRT